MRRARRWYLPALLAAQWIAVLVYAHGHPHRWTVLDVLGVLVGLPMALFCVYRIASALAGWWIGALASTLWVVVPFATIRLFDPRYRYQYTHQIVPRTLGLTESGEFPAMVVLLVACLFVLRALRARPTTVLPAALGGVATGAAAMIDASGLLFVPAALAALLAARRPRLIVPFAVGLAPAIAAVLARGTGDSIAFGSWHQLKHNGIFIREFFYSVRVLEWLPIAGFLGLGRRSIPAAVLVGGWFAMFFFVQGSSSDINDYSFWRVLLPALPAYVLLTAAIPLLVPAPTSFRRTMLARRPETPSRPGE